MRRIEDFRAVLAWWKFFELPAMFSRELSLPASLDQIISVAGVRRCGKTYLLFSTIKKLLQETGRGNVLYVNFEHERLRNLDASDLQDLLVAQREIFEVEEGKPLYLFLDEIQNVKDWERWVRRIQDEGGYRIFITGSSSKLLAGELATSLRGRCLTYTLYPLSFGEFLRAKNFAFTDLTELEYTARRGEVLRMLREYLEFGGFPEVALTENREIKMRLLSSYFETIFYRDLAERYAIKNLSLLSFFLRYLFQNFASYVSLSKIERYFKSMGLRCSKKTLANFLRYAESVFLFFPVEIFSPKVKNKMLYPKKVYCVDTGIINCLTGRFPEGISRLAENVVYLSLRRKFEPPRYEINYWKDQGGREVDFVVKEGMEVRELIQVCWNPSDEETREREIEGLVRAMGELGVDSGLVLTEDHRAEEIVRGKRVKFLPLWTWLLTP